MGGFDKSKRYQ